MGLGAGAVYAALGLAIVLTYRGAGVINFAVGAMSMSVAYIFAELRDTGDFVVLLPLVPGRIDLGDSTSLPVAFALSMAFAILLGALAHFLVFRLLRGSPPLARVVASIGLMIVVQTLVTLRLGASPRLVDPILPSAGVGIGDIVVGRDRLIVAVAVAATAALLWAVFQFTAFGRLARATTENEKGTALLGYSPDVISGINWVLASVVGGVFGILVSPITGLHPALFTLFMVPALGAALAGRFNSFGLTAAAGLSIGMIQSEFTKLQATYQWLPRAGLKEGVPFVVIIVALVIWGEGLPARGAIHDSRLPFAPRPQRTALVAVSMVALMTVLLLTVGSSYRLALITSMVGAMICLSLVVLTGYLGQISLAQMAFAGLSGFMLSKLSDTWGIPFPVAPLVAASAAAALGIIIGLPALRIRGVNLAIVTLAAGVTVEEFVFRNPAFTGGINGRAVPSPSLFGLDLGIRGADSFPQARFGILVLVVVTMVALAVANLRCSTLGRRMLAVRANEKAAAAAGINVARTKMAGFALSAFIAGLAGSMIGYQRGALSFDSFGVFVSLTFLAIAYIGGITSVSGALLGGTLATGGIGLLIGDRWLGLGKWELLLSGTGLIVQAVVNPEGVSGAVRGRYGVWQRRRSTAPSILTVPEGGG